MKHCIKILKISLLLLFLSGTAFSQSELLIYSNGTQTTNLLKGGEIDYWKIGFDLNGNEKPIDVSKFSTETAFTVGIGYQFTPLALNNIPVLSGENHKQHEARLTLSNLFKLGNNKVIYVRATYLHEGEIEGTYGTHFHSNIYGDLYYQFKTTKAGIFALGIGKSKYGKSYPTLLWSNSHKKWQWQTGWPWSYVKYNLNEKNSIGLRLNTIEGNHWSFRDLVDGVEGEVDLKQKSTTLVLGWNHSFTDKISVSLNTGFAFNGSMHIEFDENDIAEIGRTVYESKQKNNIIGNFNLLFKL